MIMLIAGASHTGKAALAQKLLERYGYPLDLLKAESICRERLRIFRKRSHFKIFCGNRSERPSLS